MNEHIYCIGDQVRYEPRERERGATHWLLIGSSRPGTENRKMRAGSGSPDENTP
jgi:hypothetical protein